MKVNPKIAAAVASILSAPTAVVFAAPPDEAATTAAGGALTEVIVTAEKRTENLQDVPITMQVLSAKTLEQLNVSTFDDFVKYLPNVTQASWGPGQSLIFMRGLSTGALGTQGSGTDANFPNVAVYLDDQSAMMPYRNLDVYAVDMERIEVLEGPQGTLFGGGAEAGAIRYITNKPKLDRVEGAVNAGYGITAHGDPNSNFDATLNLPLIQDTLAFRVVAYGERRGGYINNVPQTFTRNSADLGIAYANYATGCTVGNPNPATGLCPPSGNIAKPNVPTSYGVPPGSTTINNQANVRNAINPVDYTGIRGSLLWKINDDWNFLVTQNYQSLDAEGVFYQMPRGSDYELNKTPLPELSVTMFNPSYSKDKFDVTTWTLNGQIGWLKAIYSGGYVDRNLDSQSDYTNYSRGYFADFYQCTTQPNSKANPNPSYVHYGVPGPNSHCYSPNAWWHNTQQTTHLSHELRFSTPDDWRVRALLGGYLEQFRVYDNTDWFYKTIPPCTTAGASLGCLTNLTPPPGATYNNPATRPDNESFFDDVQRGYKQHAFFGSIDFDLIPKTLTLTAGTRYYNFKNTETGSNVSSFGCQNAGPPPSTCGTNNLNALNLDTTESGWTSRANATWHITPDVMAYYTWSQGYRPGGFNRSASCHVPVGGTGPDQWCIPQYYHPDKLTNNELGAKSEWLDHHLLVNGTLYQEDWKSTQIQYFDPATLGNLAFVQNGADYRVRGFELQLAWRVMQGLTIDGSAAWNSTSQQNSPYLIVNNPALEGTPYASLLGTPITSIPNVFGTPGSHLAQSPPFQGNLRVRYDWQSSNYGYFAQIAGTHTGSSLAYVGIIPPIAPVGSTHINYTDPAYSTLDAALGMSKDNWTAELYGQNITDERGVVFTSASQAIETQTVIRPRVLGVKVGYKF